MAAKIGDIVRFLNSVGGGRITKIKDNIAYVEDEDGFETPTLIKECVVVNPAVDNTSAKIESKLQQLPKQKEEAPSEPIIETKDGDTLNIVLAYEAQDMSHPTSTKYDAYLVNDSNYYLYFTYLSKANQDSGWTTRFSDIVEPNIQIHLEEFENTDLATMDYVAVQFIAFKKGKMFAQKNPAFIEYNLDTTKFFKIHCFKKNQYFDNPVLAFDIVKNDTLAKSISINRDILEKYSRQPVKQQQHKQKHTSTSTKSGKVNELVIDLHISELLDSTRGLSNADMLNLQVDKFREIMDANKHNHGLKIIFIHGKGEGVLRQALLKELNYRYKEHRVQDASFREYGYGATQVTIK
jgi:hypothetical protein